ncbi:MAG: hypothetical protein SPH19_05935, partial [Sodaliphilus sp.]|nr:hypothetical protein [Sodaliphilus sp.]
AHSRTAKCEAFHVAPRLFFMFFVFDYIHDSATIHNLSPAKKPKGRFFWYAFGIYKPKEPSLWFLWFATEPLRGEWWRKKGNAGRCLGLALGVGVLALEAAPTIQEVGFFSIENYTI